MFMLKRVYTHTYMPDCHWCYSMHLCIWIVPLTRSFSQHSLPHHNNWYIWPLPSLYCCSTLHKLLREGLPCSTVIVGLCKSCPLDGMRILGFLVSYTECLTQSPLRYLLSEHTSLLLLLVTGQHYLSNTDLMNGLLSHLDSISLTTLSPKRVSFFSPWPPSWVPWLSHHLYF